MIHDATHCKNYDEGLCPKDCYRAMLTKELQDRWFDFVEIPVSWAHFLGTEYCERKDEAK